MLGIRVVIPQKLQDTVLQELHSSHPGIQRMKNMARGHVCGGQEWIGTLKTW